MNKIQKGRAKAKSKAEETKKALGDKPSLQDVINRINAEAKSNVIRLAKDEDCSYILRRPTGITSLDIALAGGFPASAPSVIVGPDGAGKDYVLWRSCAEVQKTYGKDFNMVAFLTEFKLDKRFMREICGLKIAFTDEEIDELNEARTRIGMDPLTKEEKKEYTSQVGEIGVILGVTAEEGFDAILDVIESNTCQMVIVNSIGFLQTEAKEAVDSFKDFAQQRNEAMLLSKVMPALSMRLNKSSQDDKNETAIILVNQVRSKDNAVQIRGRPTMERDTYKAGSAAWALKHGKAIELMIHKGKKHIEVDTNAVLGREVPWELTKGKLGTHDGLKGSFDFFFDGGADVVGDLYNTAVSLGLLRVGGAWVSYEHPEYGFKAQGKSGARRKIIEDAEFYAHLRDECFKAAGVIYRHR